MNRRCQPHGPLVADTGVPYRGPEWAPSGVAPMATVVVTPASSRQRSRQDGGATPELGEHPPPRLLHFYGVFSLGKNQAKVPMAA